MTDHQLFLYHDIIDLYNALSLSLYISTHTYNIE